MRKLVFLFIFYFFFKNENIIKPKIPGNNQVKPKSEKGKISYIEVIVSFFKFNTCSASIKPTIPVKSTTPL